MTIIFLLEDCITVERFNLINLLPRLLMFMHGLNNTNCHLYTVSQERFLYIFPSYDVMKTLYSLTSKMANNWFWNLIIRKIRDIREKWKSVIKRCQQCFYLRQYLKILPISCNTNYCLLKRIPGHWLAELMQLIRSVIMKNYWCVINILYK